MLGLMITIWIAAAINPALTLPAGLFYALYLLIRKGKRRERDNYNNQDIDGYNAYFHRLEEYQKAKKHEMEDED